jgi:hypothetical protein
MACNENMVKFSYEWSWKRSQNWKSGKVKKIIDVIIIITIYNSFISFY